jgi:hypothetical protein
VKAFKSALFGTPAPRDKDETLLSKQTPKSPKAGLKAIAVPDEQPTAHTTLSYLDVKPSSRPNFDALASPAKGILLTPGTAATRRKTVTFGNFVDLEENNVAQEAKEVQDATSAHVSSATGSPRAFQKSRRREASLRRSLFQPRSDAIEPNEPLHEATSITAEPRTVPDMSVSNEGPGAGDNGNITIDLKHPLSRSGQHWKKEYQRDHEKSKREMRKLIQYSHTAKSYAHKRDAEALELGEKLRKAESKVEEMERRVSELASQLITTGSSGKDAATNQAELLNELAAHTTRALRYKEKAEKCKVAIQDHVTATAVSESIPGKDSQNPSSTSTVLEGQQGSSEDISSLHTEISNLRRAAKRAENKVAALERENASLKHTMAKVKQKMNDYETRHAAEKERRRRKDEKHDAKVESLKKELAQYKLRDLQPPVTALDRKPRRLDNDTRLKTLKQHHILDNSDGVHHGRGQPQTEELGRNDPGNLQATPYSPRQNPLEESMVGARSQGGHVTKSLSFQDSIDVWTAAVNDSGDDLKLLPRKVYPEKASEAPLRQSKSIEDQGGIADIAMKISQLKTPTYSEGDRPQYLSQSLPFRDFVPNSRANTLSKMVTSSRAGSLSGRPPLPPERLEAAKRRLEQRSVEKSQGVRDGKENQAP